MATKEESTSSEGSSQFNIELGPHDLSDEEISNLGNEITKTIVGAVQGKAGAGRAVAAEPYVKVLYVKLIHAKSIRQ